MFLDVVRFELAYRFRRPAVYLFAALFFAMTFGAIASDSMQLGGSIGNAARNSPFEILRLMSMVSVMGLLALTGFVATAINRDYEYRTSEFFFATPVSKSALFLGRFVGGLLTALATVCAAGLGIVVASAMPWLDPERILPFTVGPYIYSIVVYVLPNLFCAGALLYAFATLTRKVVYTYVVMLALLGLWAFGQVLLGDLESVFVASVLDPFGKTTLDLATRYWTVVERNTLLPPLNASLVLNRVLWTAVGAGLLGFALSRFRLAVTETRVRGLGARDAAEAADTREAALPEDDGDLEPLPVVAKSFTARARVAQLVEQTRVEVATIVRSVPFIVIMLFGVFNLVGGLSVDLEGTAWYPVTRVMVSTIEGTYTIFLFIFILIYAGQLVWRERQVSLHEIQGALPTPDWVPLAAKLAGLLVVAGAALVLAMGVAMAFQAAHGYFNFEVGVYLRGLFAIQMPAWFLVAALALAAQVFTNNKVAGFAVMIIFFVAQEVIGTIGLEHNLWFYGETPSAPYSDMNGYGHFVRPLFWYFLYWGFVAAVLLSLSVLFWVRGTDARGFGRWVEAKRRMTAARTTVLAVALAGVVGTGGWIFHNTNVVNEFMSDKIESRLAALYEQRYKQYEDLGQPRVTDVNLAVDIFPDERRVAVHGDLVLANKTDESIDELHLSCDSRLELTRVSLADDALRTNDEEVGYRIYALPEPLAPGEELAFSYDATITNPGFENDRSNVRVVENGTFLDTDHVVPTFGYSADRELDDPRERTKQGLSEQDDMLPPDDPEGCMKTFIVDADWVNYEATLSTSEDQIAVTSGYLEREWEDGGRRYFHYRMDIPMLHFFPILSARYEVARDRWNDVPVEIYYHHAHAWNVDRMIESVKGALEYYTANYGPYQHRVVRIVEFPRYMRFAQSFATTIPYSEGANFIQDLRGPDPLDQIFFVTAHEVAHQWWGHQVAAPYVRGGFFMEESLAQYSALMVMEEDVGRERMEKFLRYELDRYLRGRGTAREEEEPLLYTEYQPYAHYWKGSLAMYALRDYIGEDRLNEALRGYVERYAFTGPPYPNALDLVEAMRTATPPEYEYLIEDLFETITLYDNRCTGARCEAIGDGRYRVTMNVRSRKLRADGRGVETEVEHEDWIEVGVFADDPDGGDEVAILLEKRRVPSGESEVTFVVNERPVRAGIDPRHLLIDRVPDDNCRRVTS